MSDIFLPLKRIFFYGITGFRLHINAPYLWFATDPFILAAIDPTSNPTDKRYLNSTSSIHLFFR
jgi:hypothetical protein